MPNVVKRGVIINLGERAIEMRKAGLLDKQIAYKEGVGISFVRYAVHQVRRRPEGVLKLFREGFDTTQIAHRIKEPESVVYNLLAAADRHA